MKRREFLRTGLATTATIGVLNKTSQGYGQGWEHGAQGCRVVQRGSEFELHAPAFVFSLDTSVGLSARSWENKLSGRTIQLAGGAELGTDLDAAEERIWIPGWKGTVSHAQAADVNQDTGYRDGYARPEYDDSKWRGMINLTLGVESPTSFTWARTRVAIPVDSNNKPLSLTLGGFGLFDHRFMRVFLNGNEVGARRTTERWHEPLTLDLGPGSSAHAFVRFGQDNLIAVQLSEFVTRPSHLDKLDPLHERSLPGSLTWPCSPAQFEQYLTVGPQLRKVEWGEAHLVSRKEGPSGEAAFEMTSDVPGFSGLVIYRWNSDEPVLHKFVELQNRGATPVRVLHVRLGNYRTGVSVSEGEQGFPVYLVDEFFMGLAHPYGWVTGQEGMVRLRQYPGTELKPGETFKCMEAVYGVAKSGGAQKSFLAHLHRRMRRVVRGHDRAYAVFEPFGAQPGGGQDFDETESFVLDSIAKVTEGQREAGYHFDYCSLDFWVDYHGDLTKPDPQRFPHGFTEMTSALKNIGTALGLWIDSSWELWSVGGNPAVKPTLSNDPQYGAEWMALCRATEPIKSMYSRAFCYHLRENGVRLLKFDNFRPLCYNPQHRHLLGVYSTEAIGNAVIGTLHDLDAENRDVFLMLYWGYRSPWWLLHADTLFESGLAMEACSPGPSPTLCARDSVTVSLDQARWYCADVPRLGKDSLGVWLSDWEWNSSIGKEGWQEGFVMDMCRGSLLAQPWSDTPWLSPPERKQMADFIALLKEGTACFRNSRFILGNPWKNEPYGYVCSDGKRAFIALNNCTWQDVSLEVQLNQAWGLPESSGWDLYRWYPDPAQLRGDGATFSKTASLPLRPFDVVLLEVVPAGESASLGRTFLSAPLPRAFDEPSRELTLEANETGRVLTVQGEAPACGRGAMLVITVEMRKGSFAATTPNVGKYFAARGILDGGSVPCLPVLGTAIYAPASWQAWRIPIEASPAPKPFRVSITNSLEMDAALVSRGYFLPE
jgi:hypothetical protein